jgi:hypothetical protein
MKSVLTLWYDALQPDVPCRVLLANYCQCSTEEPSSALDNAFPSVANSEERTGKQPSHAIHGEDPPETLENRQPSIMWRGQGPPSATTDMTAPTKTTKIDSQKKEIMIYRGKLFETQYFGPTHPISWGARVCFVPQQPPSPAI